MAGILTLVPTPISEVGTLMPETQEFLLSHFNSGGKILIEDEKPGRRRWLGWGLPREAIEEFICYNEHTRDELDPKLISDLKKGKNLCLMSDGGMPGFCDPGRSLIYSCQEKGFTVKSLSSTNSLIPSVALSGFTEGPFEFLGFPPKTKEEREDFFKDLFTKYNHKCVVFMDTPYRLKRVLSELQSGAIATASKKDPMKRQVFFIMDIDRDTEESWWGSLSQLKGAKDFGKREFLCVLSPQ